ncbi:MAG: hypothetical protein ACREMA_10395 [Longimicrobiales bacterium]
MKRVSYLLMTAGLLAGCNWFDDQVPEKARLVIQGDAGKQVRLITSSKFISAITEDGLTRVVIVEADTTFVTLPHTATYSLKGQARFFVEAARQDVDFQTVRMEVFVDARKQFDEGGPLVVGQPMRFVYTFNQAVTREIEVI